MEKHILSPHCDHLVWSRCTVALSRNEVPLATKRANEGQRECRKLFPNVECFTFMGGTTSDNPKLAQRNNIRLAAAKFAERAYRYAPIAAG